jgi:hypothetical protein
MESQGHKNTRKIKQTHKKVIENQNSNQTLPK